MVSTVTVDLLQKGMWSSVTKPAWVRVRVRVRVKDVKPLARSIVTRLFGRPAAMSPSYLLLVLTLIVI